MRKPTRSPRPTEELIRPDERGDERAEDKLAERARAHERWIGDDGEPACRGID